MLEQNERVLDQKLGVNDNRPDGERGARQGDGGRGRNERRGRGMSNMPRQKPTQGPLC
jgi:hypothetical protein